jgi:hypothetical protein
MRLTCLPILTAALATAAAVTLTAPAAGAAATAGAAGRAPGTARAVVARPGVAYRNLALPGGQHALVYSDGLAEIFQGTGSRAEFRWVPLLNPSGGTTLATGSGAAELPSKGELIADLARSAPSPSAAQEVEVVYRDAVQAGPGFAASAQQLRDHPGLVPAYTDRPALNATLARLGVDRVSQLFAGFGTARLAALHSSAEQAAGHPLLNFSHAFILHVTAASVPAAVARLRADADVAYAAPDWTVSTTHTPPLQLSAAVTRAAAASAATGHGSAAWPADAAGVPQNYALTSSAQALLNRPGVDVVPAYASIASRYRQLPGEGETITNVSLGTLDDASAAANPADPCHFYATAYGPTTEVIGGQRYLDWPSMPLIPTYTSNAASQLDPTGQTCGPDDPNLTEVGLDFSMMAPLPHNLQRPGAVGAGLTDLLGIAPGASYRLVIPGTPGGAVSDVDAAFLAAAQQSPRPSVITASLGFGYDAYGFSARYLEDDPITEAVIAAIVHSYHVVVCVSGGDGLRTATNAAVPPSGGSAATTVAPPGGQPTSLGDVALSSVASADFDSGAIDVGATTLDDIFAAQPQNPADKALAAQHAFPETRYDGFRLFASAYGNRVNLAAPGDNVVSFSHAFGQPATAVQLNNEGGTSASAPEVAAAAAVVLQVARLTGDTKLSYDPASLRRFLAQTGTAVPNVPQSDTSNSVGPQVDVGNAVATLLAGHSGEQAPSVARVAVEQRQQASSLGGTITTATDPAALSLSGRLLNAWITIAPDWVGLPARGVRYKLRALTGPKAILATTPWARLQPAQLLAAAGQPLVSAAARSVELEYTATARGHTLTSAPVTLTFGPANGTSPSALAPIVPAVTYGATIPVRYDISQVASANHPVLVVSQPGRVDPSATGLFFRPAYTAPLTTATGTIDVPVSALAGAGIYGIGIQSAPGGLASTNYTAFAYTRVAPARSAQPPPPELSYQGSPPGHYLEIPYHVSFQVSYDVRSVGGATGASLEISAAGPTPFNNQNPFNNPNGSQRDSNGHDSGSVAFVPLPGTHGTVTVNSGSLGLYATMNHVARVLPTRFGVAAGEASGVSSLSMDGVKPSDGGILSNGYGINANSADGFLTSNQATASGQQLGSVETFDQSSDAVTSTVVSSSDAYGTPSGGCPGLFHGDTGLYVDSSATASTYNVLSPVSAGKAAGQWTLPSQDLDGIVCPAPNQATDDMAVLTGTGGPAATYRVLSSNVAKNTFGTAYSLAPALTSLGIPFAGGFGQNTTTGDAVVGIGDFANFNAPPSIVAVNLHSGALQSLTGVTTGPAEGLAVDSATNMAASGSLASAGFGIYDLTRRTGTLVPLNGGIYEHPAVDMTHSEFAVQEVGSPDLYGLTPNNNALSSVVITDENGTVVQRIEKFNFFNIFLLDIGSYLQLNPATRTAYTLGPGGTQLYPFAY